MVLNYGTQLQYSITVLQALEKYNRIFSFLLLVRRTQAALHGLWSQAMFKNR